MTVELWQLGALDLAAAIRRRDVSSREVVLAHLDRIETINPHLGAVTEVLADEALAAALACDQRLLTGEDVGALHGVPITVKENVDVAGSATTWGVSAFAGAIAKSDAPHIAHLRAAGAIPLGRTNMPDFALRWHTDSSLRGATVNPWDPSRTPGGSSGGEAVALSTGMSPLGVANDLSGSLRWPAQCVGTAAVRPTMGRVPDATVIEPVNALITTQLCNVQGPMARTIRDLRLALEIMSRSSPRDPWYVPAPLTGPPPVRPVRVAVVRDPGGLGVHSHVAEGIEKAARVLVAAGYEVEDVEPPGVMEAVQTWADLIATEFEIIRPQLAPVMSGEVAAFFDVAAMPAASMNGYASALMARQGLLRAWSQFLVDYPLVLAPISTGVPFEVGRDLTSVGMREATTELRVTIAVSLLGLPAVAVPVGVSCGLPQAVQIVGARYREDLCLEAAEAIEECLGTPAPIEPRLQVVAGGEAGAPIEH